MASSGSVRRGKLKSSIVTYNVATGVTFASNVEGTGSEARKHLHKVPQETNLGKAQLDSS
jgi:hypothetical protein